MYENGSGVPEDEVEAARWCRKAAEQGLAEAQDNLGYMYFLGKGVARDLVQAARWSRKAAEQGAAWAQFRIGLMYDSGEGVPKDNVEAYFWLNLAAHGDFEGVQQPAGEIRDRLEHSMTVQQIAEAQTRTVTWRTTRYGR
jgi:hypothetical protein